VLLELETYAVWGQNKVCQSQASPEGCGAVTETVTLVPVEPVTQLQEAMPAPSVRGAAFNGVQVTASLGEMVGPVVVWGWWCQTSPGGGQEPRCRAHMCQENEYYASFHSQENGVAEDCNMAYGVIVRNSTCGCAMCWGPASLRLARSAPLQAILHGCSAITACQMKF